MKLSANLRCNLWLAFCLAVLACILVIPCVGVGLVVAMLSDPMTGLTAGVVHGSIVIALGVVYIGRNTYGWGEK